MYGRFVVSLFPIARTLQLPTYNVMNIMLVQTTWAILYSWQEVIQWLWAISWRVRHWIVESNEDPWSMVTTTICLRWLHTYLLFWWHTLWQLGKALNNQHGNTNKKYNTNISRHKRTNKQQHHAKDNGI